MSSSKYNILNIIVAISNLPVIYPILTSINNNDYITASIITFVGLGSSISHLFESHKHGMVGFNMPVNYSYILNRIDILGVILTSLRLLYLWYNRGFTYDIFNTNIIIHTLIAFSYSIISEYDKTKYTRTIYVISHVLWHISAFTLIDSLLHILY